MTQTLHVKRCARMTKQVKLCAEALMANMDGLEVIGVEGVAMSLRKGQLVVETKRTGKSGVAEFALRIPQQDMEQYSVQAALEPADMASYQFRGQPSQNYEHGLLFEKTKMAYVHQMRFHFQSKAWIALCVLNQAGKILSGLTVKIIYPDGGVLTRKLTRQGLQADGSHKLINVPPGDFQIAFPELDAELWEPTILRPVGPLVYADSTVPESIPSSGHRIASGESLAAIAARYGTVKERIWTYGANKALASQYPNPDTLLPGETLYIPKHRQRPESVPALACHYFLIKEMPRLMKVTMMRGGKALAEGSEVKVNIAGKPELALQADKDGAIEFTVPPGAMEAKVAVADWFIESYVLKLSALRPVETQDGVRERLTNLGFYSAPSNGADDKRALQAAVKTFQRSRGLPATGVLGDGRVDAKTMEALVTVNGA